MGTAIDDMLINEIERVTAKQTDLFGGYRPALISTELNDPEVVRTGRPGRPKGAKNENTKEWSSHTLSKYQSLLMFWAKTYNHPVHMLAKKLEVTGLKRSRCGERALANWLSMFIRNNLSRYL